MKGKRFLIPYRRISITLGSGVAECNCMRIVLHCQNKNEKKYKEGIKVVNVLIGFLCPLNCGST